MPSSAQAWRNAALGAPCLAERLIAAWRHRVHPKLTPQFALLGAQSFGVDHGWYCITWMSALGAMSLAGAHQMARSPSACWIRASAVTSGRPVSSAAAAIMRSNGSGTCLRVTSRIAR